MDWAPQRRNNTALASTVCNRRIESLLANSGDVYNPHSDHLAGGLVQQGLSVAIGIAPYHCFGGATDKRYSLELMSTAEQLARSHELAAWIERQVDGLPGPALLKNRLASPCFVVVQEHHQAILLLLGQQHPLHASAFALVRPVYESLVRGVWLWQCANEEELQAFSKGGRPPTIPTMLEAVEQTPGYAGGQLSAIYAVSWDTMCAYTHTGAQQVQRWNTSDSIAPNYSDEEVNEVLCFSGTFALLSTLGLATVAADEALAHRVLEKSREWAK